MAAYSAFLAQGAQRVHASLQRNSGGGFTPKAYSKRVLVIRGSLDQPETYIVNVGAVLSAEAADFLVQPKDIIFVADRPWARVEELVDIAIKSFIITATSEWVNVNVAPIITEPIIPGL